MITASLRTGPAARVRVSLTLLAAATVVPLIGMPARAAAPIGPSLVLEPTQHYPVGVQVEHSDPDVDYWEIPGMQFRWQTYSASGICKQAVTEQNYNTTGGDTDPVLGTDTATFTVPKTARAAGIGTHDVFDYFRGNNTAVVRVTDCKGHTTTSTIAQAIVSWVEDTSNRIHYAGAWSTTHFKGFTFGTTHATSQAGASLTASVQGGAFGLVMEKAPDRGEADLYIDGVKRARLDTYASTTAHRTIVWETRLAPGTHTVRIVNAGTAGHPRIDLDALLAQ